MSDTIVVTADILLLKEQYHFQREADLGAAALGAPTPGANSDVLSGKFTWKVHNISMFMEVMSMQVRPFSAPFPFSCSVSVRGSCLHAK